MNISSEVLALAFFLLIRLSEGGEHVHIKLRVPKMINKHTHVETKYVHVFHPHKSAAPHRPYSGSFHHRLDPYPSRPFNATSLELYRAQYPRKHSAWRAQGYGRSLHRAPKRPAYNSFEDFFDGEGSNHNYNYYDMDHYPVDRQADAIYSPMVDKIFITTPPPPEPVSFRLPKYDPSTESIRNVRQEVQFTTPRQPQFKRRPVGVVSPPPPQMPATSTQLNIRFVTPKPRFPRYPHFTTPYTPKKRRQRPQKYKKTESLKMIQVPLNLNSENDVQIMLKPKKKVKDGEVSSTKNMEHTIKTKTGPSPFQALVKQKKALAKAVLEPIIGKQ